MLWAKVKQCEQTFGSKVPFQGELLLVFHASLLYLAETMS